MFYAVERVCCAGATICTQFTFHNDVFILFYPNKIKVMAMIPAAERNAERNVPASKQSSCMAEENQRWGKVGLYLLICKSRWIKASAKCIM